MRKNKFDVGDLVEITNTESAFKAHPDMMSGKLAIVTQPPSMHSSMFVYFVLVDGVVVSVMEDHLKEPAGQEKIKQYEEYTD
jgi:hypothetical protein